MIVSYKKLSEGDEKSLSEIVDAENTYIAAFKEGEKNYKVPIADFNSSQDSSKVYKFTAERKYQQYDSTGTLVIYDVDHNIVNDISVFEELYDDGYTILIGVTDDDKMPYYSKDYIDKPECIFRLSSTYVYSYTNRRIFNFTFIETQEDIISAVYTITIKSETGVPLATMQYQNPYAKLPLMAIPNDIELPLNRMDEYPKCIATEPNKVTLPTNFTLNYKTYFTEKLAFGIFLWDQNYNKNEILKLEPPSELQKKLRAEFIIVWINSPCTAIFRGEGQTDILNEPHCSKIETPSIINASITDTVKIISDRNDYDHDCETYTYSLFKITALGCGWQVTPLVNCQFYSYALYCGAYAYNVID